MNLKQNKYKETTSRHVTVKLLTHRGKVNYISEKNKYITVKGTTIKLSPNLI